MNNFPNINAFSISLGSGIDNVSVGQLLYTEFFELGTPTSKFFKSVRVQNRA